MTWSLYVPLTAHPLPVVVVHGSSSVVEVELTSCDPIPGPELKISQAITMIPRRRIPMLIIRIRVKLTLCNGRGPVQHQCIPSPAREDLLAVLDCV